MTPMSPIVLVVEDETALVTLLRYNLEREGFRVAEAGDGEEALLVAREQKPDLVLLDWMLPLLSGLEVCRQMRRMPETRGVPIIMLTARGEEGDKLRGLDSGADDYVTKPFSPSELIARVRAVLRRSRPSDQRRDHAVRGSDHGPGRAPGAPQGPRRASRSDGIPPAAPSAGASGPGVQHASSCWTRSGATTSMSSRARWMCISAGCARR